MKNEILKPSMFNNVFKDGNELLMFNALSGYNSLCRVSKEKSGDIYEILNQKEVKNNKTNDFEFLIENGYLVDKGTDEKLLREAMFIKRMNRITNLGLIILPTEKCNFRCKYCYESYKFGAMSQEVQDSILKFIRKNIHEYSSLYIAWFGGEPMIEMGIINSLSQKMIEICKSAKRLYSASITTNGYFLTLDNFAELLNNRVINYQITVDGIKEIHDSKRPLINGEGTFDTIFSNLANIKKYIKDKKFHITIRLNVTAEALVSLKAFNDQFADMLQGDPRFSLFIRPVGNWGGNNKISELKEGLIGLDNLSIVYKNFRETNKTFTLNAHAKLYNNFGTICYAGLASSFIINPIGTIQKCTCALDDKINNIGTLSSDGTMSIDYVKEAHWINHLSRFNEVCDDCSFSPACYASNCPRYKKVSCPQEKICIYDELKAVDACMPFKIL